MPVHARASSRWVFALLAIALGLALGARLYVSDETGGTATVIDARSNQRIATVEFGGAVGRA